jgi:hypothetical protein
MTMWLVWGVGVAWAVDADGDGFDAAVDCDDSNGQIHPGASEGGVPDGVDQDCTGLADDVRVCGVGAPFTSVQDGIDAAPDGFTVVLCAGVYTEPVRLNNQQLRLLGAGLDVTALHGGGVGRVVDIDDSAVWIEGLTVLGGSTTGDGGGIRCDDSALQLYDSAVRDNVAGEGGGLHADDCALDVSLVLFADNVATSGDGGGVWVQDGGGVIADSTIVRNEAEQGGGIGTDWLSVVEIVRNTVRFNTARSTATEYDGGGGVFVDGNSPVRDNLIADNHSAMTGGGLFFSGSGDVTGNRFLRNTCADDGAGVFGEFPSGLFSDNLVKDNDATDDAGGLRVYRGSLTMEDNRFIGNSAGDDGGGVKMSHSTNTFRRNTLIGNSAGDAGGGLELDNEDTNVVDCLFRGNSATRGGGMHSWDNESPHDVVRTVFVGNRADDCGGGIAIDNDAHTVSVVYSTFLANHSDDDGGALCIEEWTPPEDPVVASEVYVAHSTFGGNTADDEGGAMQVQLGELHVDNSVLLYNDAPDGAGLLADDNGALWARNTIFVGHGADPVVEVDAGGAALLTYNDFWQGAVFDGLPSPIGANGNVSVDPMLVDPFGGDVHLQGASPVIDAGDPALSDPDGTRSDMGVHGGPAAMP